MAKVTWGKRALRELEEIASYIAFQSEANASVVAERISRSVALLSEHPEIGRPGRVAGTRELAIQNTPFILAYRFRASEVRILGIQRGAKVWPPQY